ncbi:MAG: RNA polymerase sigma factor RpoH [Francisellaceae bacterium]|jgi:RNA polymerase sigma-32 factor|nr:RNA polymerase sigma factor RpoH [Francisellaceae bacterium]MBT6206643.1 RNA polymerase sigma factor RpoH [Francisellaceae bacterium]MBT6538878.1 RNA polymerase sigma factor RpoH [Francisellaceae bacterium]
MTNKEISVYQGKKQSTIPIGSLDAYIERINSIPMLTKEEEIRLAERLQNDGDLQAAQRLVAAHLRYVVRVAKGYMGYGLMLSDLIQEGTVGLMKGVKRFQPDRGVRLVSFAVHWIKAEIHEYVIKNWKIAKVATTKAQRKLFFNLRSAKTRLGWFTKEEIDAVAKDLGVKPEEVVQMEQRLSMGDVPFELPGNDDESAFSPADYLKSSDKDPSLLLEVQGFKEETRKAFLGAYKQLDERSKDIIQKRWLVDDDDKVTLQELALFYNISAERIRQLEANAIKKLQKFMVPALES